MSVCAASFLTLGTHSAEAKCGSVFKPQLEVSKNYSGDVQPKVKFQFEIPLGDHCAEERAKAAEKEADAAEQRIKNLERLIKICDKKDLPVCDTLEQLSMEIYQ